MAHDPTGHSGYDDRYYGRSAADEGSAMEARPSRTAAAALQCQVHYGPARPTRNVRAGNFPARVCQSTPARHATGTTGVSLMGFCFI